MALHLGFLLPFPFFTSLPRPLTQPGTKTGRVCLVCDKRVPACDGRVHLRVTGMRACV